MSAPFNVVCRHFGDYLGEPPIYMPAFEQGAGNAKNQEQNLWHHNFHCHTCQTTERVSGVDLFRLGYWRLCWGLEDVPLVGLPYLLEKMRRAERNQANSGGNDR